MAPAAGAPRYWVHARIVPVVDAENAHRQFAFGLDIFQHLEALVHADALDAVVGKGGDAGGRHSGNHSLTPSAT